MRWHVLLGVVLAALLIAVCYAVVWALGPWGARVAARPWVSAVRGRARAAAAWPASRVAADVVVLLAGAALVLGLAAVFAEILDQVVDADGLTVVDRPVVTWLAGHRTSALNGVEIAVTDLGGAVALVSAVAVTAVVAARRLRSWYPVLLAVAGLGGIQLLVAVIKVVIARPRPDLAGRIVEAGGYSFPSGHAASSLVGFALLAWLVCLLTTSGRVRATAWLAAAAGTAAVGVSRVYLGVHYPSDVLGGWVLGLTWLAVVAVAARVWRTRGAVRRGSGR